MRIPRIQFSLAFILILTGIVAVYFAFEPDIRAYYASRDLNNSDLNVNGSIFGLLVFHESEAADTLRKLDTRSNRWLLSSLKDPDKFAAAHELLLHINREKFIAADRYWGYEMDPFAMASNDFDKSQIPALVNFWTKVIQEPSGFTEEDLRIRFDSNAAEYSIGDLVPCSKTNAKFLLVIKAKLEGEFLYERSQYFCYHSGKLTAPDGLPGVASENIETDLPNGGSLCGQFQYSSFDPKTVKLKIEWFATIGDDTHYFGEEFSVITGELNGWDSEYLGNNKKFVWTFKAVSNDH